MRALAGILSLAAIFLLAGCSAADPQNTLAPEGPVAQRQAELFWLVFAIMVAVFIFVEGLIVFVVFRYRARREGVIPAQVHGNTRLELGWTIAPSIVLAVLAVPTFATLWDLSRRPSAAENPLEVRVIARQWWWEFQYPQLTNPNDNNRPLVVANELHIPAGRKVIAYLESGDIIHSFWIPKLAGKQDVIPAQTNELWFEASQPGEYLGQCMEFCGLSHANMRLRVFVQSEQDFQSWVQAQQRPAATPSGRAARGAELFQNNPVQGCSSCHAIRGTEARGVIAPDLTHFASRETFGGATFERTEENLRRWLQNPPEMKPGARMPVFENGLTNEQIDDLIAYLQSLQ
jgi:cytochrome c oxidase subunit 2